MNGSRFRRTRAATASFTTESAERFFDLSHDLLALVSFDGTFARVNQAWRERLGWDPDELVGRSILEFIHDADADRTRSELRALRAGRPTAAFRNRYCRADGGWRWIEWRATPDVDAGLVLAAGRDVTEAVQLQARLRERERLLSDLVARQLRVRDDERRRIASDLHDSAVQHIVATLMFCEALDAPDAEPQRLAPQITTQARCALESVRTIMRGLDPLPVAEAELDAAIREQARTLATRFGMWATVAIDVPPDLDPAVAGAAYRIVREAVTNAGKHSCGRHVDVDVHGEGEVLVVVVRDDGSGRSDATSSRGTGRGVELMRARARAVGGEASIDFTDTGTTVRALLPLRPPARADS